MLNEEPNWTGFNDYKKTKVDKYVIQDIARWMGGDSKTYREKLLPIIKVIKEKKRRGEYSDKQAVKLFEPAIKAIEKYYQKTYDKIERLSPSNIEDIAYELLDVLEDDINEGIHEAVANSLSSYSVEEGPYAKDPWQVFVHDQHGKKEVFRFDTPNGQFPPHFSTPEKAMTALKSYLSKKKWMFREF